MKIAITGANGLLGSAFKSLYNDLGVEYVSLNRDQIWSIVKYRDFNLLNGVDFLIHAAANTNVEQCEIYEQKCYEDNYLLTAELAIICAYLNLRMVYISSTGVYGQNRATPYCEYDEVFPTTTHHRAKLLGEKSVILSSIKNIVIRTGWLFGGDLQNPKNFIINRLREAASAAQNNEILYSDSSQFGSPSYTKDVVERVNSIMLSNHAGVFNVVNCGTASRYEYVSEIIRLSCLPVKIKPVNSLHFKRLARVSANEMAINWRANLLGFPDMPKWTESLDAYMELIGEKNKYEY